MDVGWIRLLTSLSTVSPSLEIIFGFFFDYFNVSFELCDVQSGLQHFLLLQK